MVSHNQVVDNYFNSRVRDHYNKGSRVFFEGDTLYSYGTHFILAQKCKNGYILNGDGYSVSTSKHQGITRSKAPNNSPVIPFSALEQIFGDRFNFSNDLSKIEIIDKTDDTFEEYKYKDKDGNEQTEQRHYLGASLIKYKNKYYLSSIDSGAKRYDAYFLVELPTRHSLMVEQAYRELAGNLSHVEYLEYQEGNIERQGEYFLKPVQLNIHDNNLSIFTNRKGNKGLTKKYDLSRGKGNAHIATEYIRIDSKEYIRGTLRHRDHKMISLGKIWHKVIRNTAVRSFTSSGRVD